MTMTTLHDLLPLLSPLALAMLEKKIIESLDSGLANDHYISLLALSAAIRQRGYALLGDDYIYLAGATAELDDRGEDV